MGNNNTSGSTAAEDASTVRMTYRQWREGEAEGIDQADHADKRSRANSDNAWLGLETSSSSRPDTPLMRPSSTAPRGTGGVFPPEVKAPPWATKRAGEHDGLVRLVHAVTELLVGPPFTTPTTPAASPIHAESSVVLPFTEMGNGNISSATAAPAAPTSSPKHAATSTTTVVNHLFLPVCDKVDEFLRGMPDWYTDLIPANEVASHIRLLLDSRRLVAEKRDSSLSVLIHQHHDSNGDVVPSMYIVAVVAHDQRQLLDSITRCISTRASVMEATIATTRDGFALDRFVVFDQTDAIDPHPAELTMLAHALKSDIDLVLANLPPVDSPQLASQSLINHHHNRNQRLDSRTDDSDNGSSPATPTHGATVIPRHFLNVTFGAAGAAAAATGGSGITTAIIPGNTTSTSKANTPERRPRPRNSSLSSKRKPVWEIPFQDVRLIRVLGQGVSGNVFLAEFQGKRVAAKVLRRRTDQEEAFLLKSVVDDFNNELALVSRLNHRNVVKFLGAASRPPRFLTIYELCEGGNVASLIPQKTRKYSFFQVAIEAATGLAYIHAHDIIHRDVKPENLLLDGEGHVKVTDFGLSRLVEKDEETLTAETGSYKYMSPEVTAGQHYSFPVDVYSFGLVLGALIAKKHPFAEFTPIQAAMATSKGVRPAMPRRGVPAGLLEDVVQRCWDANPHVRPSFDVVVAMLNTLRDGLSKNEKGIWDYQVVIKTQVR